MMFLIQKLLQLLQLVKQDLNDHALEVSEISLQQELCHLKLCSSSVEGRTIAFSLWPSFPE